SALALSGKAGRDDQQRIGAFLGEVLVQPVPPIGGPTNPKFVDGLLRQAAVAQIVARRLRLWSPKRLLVVECGLIEQLDQLAAPLAGPVVRLPRLERHAGTTCQLAQRLGKV